MPGCRASSISPRTSAAPRSPTSSPSAPASILASQEWIQEAAFRQETLGFSQPETVLEGQRFAKVSEPADKVYLVMCGSVEETAPGKHEKKFYEEGSLIVDSAFSSSDPVRSKNLIARSFVLVKPIAPLKLFALASFLVERFDIELFPDISAK